MDRIESEWLVAWAVVNAGIWRWQKVADESLINVGRNYLMKKCRKCGREYHADCIPCTFRNGGDIQENGEHEDDLIEQMTDLQTDRGFKLEIAFRWMRIQSVATSTFD